MSQQININDTSHENITQRKFISNILIIARASTFALLAVSAINSCSDETNPADSGVKEAVSLTIDLSEDKYKNLTVVGGVLSTGPNKLDDKGMLLYRPSESLVKAYSRECPYKQCIIRSFQGSISTCPCHGSKFNTNGLVIKGPANSPLKGYNTSLSGDLLTIIM